MSSIEVYRDDAGVLRWRDAWFWHFTHADDRELSNGEINRLLEAMRLHRAGRKAPLLVEGRHASDEALMRLLNFAADAPEMVTAIAFCICCQPHNATAQLVAHYFQKGLSAEIFGREEDAAEWLKAFARD